MAALTWRDVAAPQFAGVNQAYQGAGVTLDRALSGLSEGLKQFATTNQEGVDKSFMSQTMKADTADKMRGLLANMDLTKASPKTLETMGQRVTQLLGQASTEQSISSSKTSQSSVQQGIDFGSVNQAHTVQERNNEIAARAQQARNLGITGPMANLPTTDQRDVVTHTSNMLSARLNQTGQQISNDGNSFINTVRKRDDGVTQASMANAARVLSETGSIEGIRSNVAGTEFDSPGAELATIKLLSDFTGQKLHTPVDAPVDKPAGRSGSASSGSNSNSNSGSGAAGKGGKYTPPMPYEFQSEDARMADQALARVNAQDNSAGTLSAVERTIGDFRPPLDIAKEIAEKIPGASQAKIADMIVKAKAKHPNMLPSEIGAALEFSPAGSRWYDSGNTTIGDDQGIDDKTFETNLTKMANGKVDYMSAANQNTRAARKALEKADKAVASSKKDLLALYQRSQQQGGKIPTFDAEEKLQRAQDRLNELLQLQKETASQQPTYEPVAPPPSDANVLKRLFEAGKIKRGGN